MENRIELEFKKSTTRLAGNPYGRSVFSEQVKDKLDLNKINIIVFPENIEKIASSFVQGFFADIITEIGYLRFEKIIKIETNRVELKEEIMRDLFS